MADSARQQVPQCHREPLKRWKRARKSRRLMDYRALGKAVQKLLRGAPYGQADDRLAELVRKIRHAEPKLKPASARSQLAHARLLAGLNKNFVERLDRLGFSWRQVNQAHGLLSVASVQMQSTPAGPLGQRLREELEHVKKKQQSPAAALRNLQDYRRANPTKVSLRLRSVGQKRALPRLERALEQIEADWPTLREILPSPEREQSDEAIRQHLEALKEQAEQLRQTLRDADR